MGTVNTIESGSEVTITLDADAGEITAGGTGDAAGRILVKDNAGLDAIKLTGDGAHMEIGAGGAGNDGRITIRDRVVNKVFEFNGADAALYIGANSKPGKFAIKGEEGRDVFEFDGDNGRLSVRHKSGIISVLDPELGPSGREVFNFDTSSGNLIIGNEGNDGGIIVRDEKGKRVLDMLARNGKLKLGAEGKRGGLTVLDDNARQYVDFGSTTRSFTVGFGGSGKDGKVVVKDILGDQTLEFRTKYTQLIIGSSGKDGEQGRSGEVLVMDRKRRPSIALRGHKAKLVVGSKDNDGDIRVLDEAERDVFLFDGKNADLHIGAKGNEGDIRVKDGKGRSVFHFDGNHANLYVGAKGNEGDIRVKDGKGRNVFRFDGNSALLEVGSGGARGSGEVAGNAGEINVYNGKGAVVITLDGRDGSIFATGGVFSGGGDCAEEFDVAGTEEIDPGAVLVIDDESRLRPCEAEYDKKVAGVVSGANGLNPGMVLGKNGACNDNDRLPIALNGKVYCKVDAGYSPIQTGDLLTTSPTVGHAMRADDPLKAFGAVIGKALSPLKEGRGMVPILVALQ